MKAAVKVDTREFVRTMLEYARNSKKDLATICNSKLRDVMARATEMTPMAYKARNLAYIDNPPAFVTWLATQRLGKGFKRPERSKIWIRWYGKKVGRGFMKSGFARAARLLRTAIDGDNKKTRPEPKRYAELTRSSARVRKAVGLWLTRAFATAEWKAHMSDPEDAPLKQEIINRSTMHGLNHVTADMRAYMLRKAEKTAAKASRAK